MAIYDATGQQVYHAYDKYGAEASYAYDRDGNVVYRRQPITFKVMQYNCGQWYIGSHDNVPADLDEAYYDLQYGIVTENDADVILLEEYTAQFSKAGRTALSWLGQIYPYYHEQTNGTTTTVTQRAIYSKYPISNYATHPFNDGSTYYFDSCDITINGLSIHFIVTHLHWNDISKRTSEAALILANANNYDYAVIGGDFNTTDNFDTSGADYVAILKPFVDAGYKLANGGEFDFLTTYGDGNSSTTACLDNIIISSNIDFNSVTVDRTKETDDVVAKIDHEPVIAVVQIDV